MKKTRARYWYLFHHSYCDVGGHDDVEKERVYDRPKPSLWSQRHIYTNIGACYSCQYDMYMS